MYEFILQNNSRQMNLHCRTLQSILLWGLYSTLTIVDNFDVPNLSVLDLQFLLTEGLNGIMMEYHPDHSWDSRVNLQIIITKYTEKNQQRRVEIGSKKTPQPDPQSYLKQKKNPKKFCICYVTFFAYFCVCVCEGGGGGERNPSLIKMIFIGIYKTWHEV